MEIAEAEQALAGWKQNADRRDELIRAAYAAGVNIRRIGQLSGLSRNTVYKILGMEGGQQ
jgi:transcriptional regulator of acetoin/glycerol metabolism